MSSGLRIYNTASVPIHKLSMLPSPSPIPSFVQSTALVFTTTPPQPSLPYGAHSRSSEGPLPYVNGTGHGGMPHPPCYYKLDFPTYDCTVDPLNWLNYCEQFFRG